MIWLLLACATEPQVEEVRFVELDAPRLLRRMSLDLRGVLPTVDELDRVAADPAELDALRDEMLQDERLHDRLVWLFGEHLRTRLDVFQVKHYDYGFEDDEACAFEQAVAEEPLRLMAHVATQDLPWTDVVTMDTTFVEERLGASWPVDYPADGEGWQQVSWTDGRPAAGLLSTNGFWWRYVTSESNANRSRAAALSRALLCVDFLGRPVSFATAPSLADEGGTAAALQTEDACINCHSAVDPLAGALMGFYPTIDYNPLELGYYHAERELLAEQILGVEPAYFGTPVSGLAELGARVASDPRFTRCAAETAASLLWRRQVSEADRDQVDALHQRFLDRELLFRELLVAVTDTPQYRAGALGPAADEADHAREHTTRMMTSDLLGTAVDDLTGFSWEYAGCEQLNNDDHGYRVLAGGVDGVQLVRAPRDPGLTTALVWERVAQSAAEHAVVLGGELVPVDESARPGDPDFDQTLDELVWRLMAVEPSTTERDALVELWEAVEALDGAEAAWTVLLSTLLRDPAFLSY